MQNGSDSDLDKTVTLELLTIREINHSAHVFGLLAEVVGSESQRNLHRQPVQIRAAPINILVLTDDGPLIRAFSISIANTESNNKTKKHQTA